MLRVLADQQGSLSMSTNIQVQPESKHTAAIARRQFLLLGTGSSTGSSSSSRLTRLVCPASFPAFTMTSYVISLNSSVNFGPSIVCADQLSDFVVLMVLCMP
jgi:hypothetical protein